MLALATERGFKGATIRMPASITYTVEVLGHGDDLIYMMDEVKRWRQDNSVYAPRTEFYWVSGTLVFEVTFHTWTVAMSFARSFDGRLLESRASE